MTNNTRIKNPALYNPALTAALSLVFTPVFGGLLQAKNWEVLGDRAMVRNSRMWVRASCWLMIVFVIMKAAFRHEPVMQFAGLYFLIVLWSGWMLTTGRRQIRHVRNLFGENYVRKPLGRALLIGAGGWVIYTLMTITANFAMTAMGVGESDLQSGRVGVTIRVPEGSDKAVIEPLRPLPEIDMPQAEEKN